MPSSGGQRNKPLTPATRQASTRRLDSPPTLLLDSLMAACTVSPAHPGGAAGGGNRIPPRLPFCRRRRRESAAVVEAVNRWLAEGGGDLSAEVAKRAAEVAEAYKPSGSGPDDDDWMADEVDSS